MLGHNELYHFYPCISLILGDGPAQKEICGVYGGSFTRRNCTYCVCKVTEDQIYREGIIGKRNSDYMIQKCEEVNNFVFDNEEKSPFIKRCLQELKNWCIYPWVNSFHNAPFGVGGNIYNATPPDLMHTILAGIMKGETIWILNIIRMIGIYDKKYTSNMSILDERFTKFIAIHPSSENFIPWEYFRNGISQFVDDSSSKRNKTTGTFSGFRSKAFISIIFQLYFCLCNDDSILPNTALYKVFIKKDRAITIRNLLKIVKGCLLSTLDVYFDLKQLSYTETDINNLQSKIYGMVDYINSLWKIKQALTNSDRIYHMSNNIHKVVHLPDYIRLRGNMIQQDTGTYETSHKTKTKEIYSRSNKDKSILYGSMLENATLQHLEKFCKFAEDCTSMTYEEQKVQYQYPKR